MMMRGFGFYVSFIFMLLLVAGLFLGVSTSTPSTSGLYAITILYIVAICTIFQWTLIQIFSTEGTMVSAERMKVLETI